MITSWQHIRALSLAAAMALAGAAAPGLTQEQPVPVTAPSQLVPVTAPSQPVPVTAPILAGVKVAERNACAVIRIAFNSPVQLVSHAPTTGGDELRIQLLPLDKDVKARSEVVNQESLRAPANDRAGVHAIELVYDAKGAALSVYFKRNVAWAIASSTDHRSLLIAVPGAEPSAACVPVFDEHAVAGAAAGGADNTPAHSDADAAAAAARDQSIATARSALNKGDFDQTLALLKDASLPADPRHTAEIIELKGVALEQKGLRTEAQAEYRAYLDRYPTGAGADRMHARLAAMDKSGKPSAIEVPMAQAAASMPLVAGGPVTDGAIGAPSASDVNAWSSGTRTIDDQKDPDGWRLTQQGSVSLYYNRNQGGRDFYVPPRLQLGWDKDNIYQIYQNSALGSLDYGARFENADFIGKLQIAAAQDSRYIEGQTDQTSVSSAYFDGEMKAFGLSGRIGRQSRFTGGVLGRFDGAFASYKLFDGVKVNAVAGSPVERSRDRPFLNDTQFYGTSADFGFWDDALSTSVFFIDQRTDGLIDRQGVGAEVRVNTDAAWVSGTLDYDVHYMELNNAILSGSYNFPDFSSVGLNFDYRRAPLIFTSNALQGQPVATLSELLQIYTHVDLERYALDRTARAYTASANYMTPLSENVQFLADATATYMSGTPESGGVAASPSTGMEYYGFAQLSRSDLIADGDLYSVGLRYGDTDYARRYGLELSGRYPVTADWQIGPILRMGYVDDKTDGQSEYQFMPSLRVGYYVTPDVLIELEGGKKWLERQTVHGIEQETELTILAGVRYDFHGEHQK
ncbi:MAG: tetratricopeptide repeat protein [Hyphomicrobium sp.]